MGFDAIAIRIRIFQDGFRCDRDPNPNLSGWDRCNRDPNPNIQDGIDAIAIRIRIFRMGSNAIAIGI
jgi:hypothetical protein